MRTRVLEYDEVPPNAPLLISSISASDFNSESAVADIIENSASAGASNVAIIINEVGEDRSSGLVFGLRTKPQVQQYVQRQHVTPFR
jgi:hypothetical protein